MGDRIRGYWRYAFALAQPDGAITSFTSDTPRIFVSVPSEQRMPGYPLESLQIDPESGKYISEMTDDERAEFWRQSIGHQLTDFMLRNYI